MKKQIKNIGIFTSGGDSPGMNATIYAITKAAADKKVNVTGIIRGYDGMIDGEFINLNNKKLNSYVKLGGTILKSARSPRFLTLEGRKKALKNLEDQKIDALIAIGGDGTFKGLLALRELTDIPFIGIPGTIDNDLAGTDYTLGFDTAVNTAVDAIDKIRDTAESHNRIFLVEVMGRDSGYIAVNSGLCSAADGILIPESTDDINDLLNKMLKHNPKEALIIVVAEGDEIGAVEVSEMLKKLNDKIELRITILGHIQRGGSPSVFDRLLGIRLGVASVKELLKGSSDMMGGLLNNQVNFTSFNEVLKHHKVKTELHDLIHLFST